MDLQKRLEGVLPNPSGTGVGGGQPSTEGSPTQQGTEPAANQTVPSEVPEAPRADVVPRGLHDRISEKLTRTQEQLEGAEAELARLRSMTEVGESSSLRPGYEEKIASLRSEAESLIETDPARAIRLMDEASNLRAQSAANNAMENMLKQMQTEQQQHQFQQQSRSAAQQALTDFPELQDPNSAFYREVDRIYSADPELQQLPTGILRAAREADYQRRMRSPNAPAQLEGAGAPTISTPVKVDSSEQAKAIKSRLRQGSTREFEQALAENFEEILSDDQLRRR